MKDELKPVKCGCGGYTICTLDWYPEIEEGATGTMWKVRCVRCGISITGNGKQKAIEAWNKAMSADAYKAKATERTAKVETVEKPNVFKCSECGQYFHSTAWGSPVEYCSRCGCRLDWDEDIPMEYFESGGK